MKKQLVQSQLNWYWFKYKCVHTNAMDSIESLTQQVKQSKLFPFESLSLQQQTPQQKEDGCHTATFKFELDQKQISSQVANDSSTCTVYINRETVLYNSAIDALSRAAIKDVSKFIPNYDDKMSAFYGSKNKTKYYSNEDGYSRIAHLMAHGEYDRDSQTKTESTESSVTNSEKKTDNKESESKQQNNESQSRSKYYYAMQHCEGQSLLEYTFDIGDIKDDLQKLYIVGKLIKEILCSVKYLHDRNICHGNIKPAVFRFVKKADVQENEKDINTIPKLLLTKFDFSRILDDNFIPDINGITKSITKRGTRKFSAPEYIFVWWARVRSQREDSNENKSDNTNNNENNKDNINDNANDNDLFEETFQFIDKELRENITNFNDIHKFELLFGWSFEERYRRWVNIYDNLPIYDQDKPRMKIRQRYCCQTPRMAKAGDIWAVGITAYLLMCGTYPFSLNTFNYDEHQQDELILTASLRFVPRDRRNHRKLDIPAQFKVKYI